MGLINFAHGELIMVGAFTIVLIGHPVWPVIVLATIGISVVIALAMERVAFRPLRGAQPATLLIASFAVSYLLQNLAILIEGSAPKGTSVSTCLPQASPIGPPPLAPPVLPDRLRLDPEARRRDGRRPPRPARGPRLLPPAHPDRRADAGRGRGLPHGADPRRPRHRRDRDRVRDQRTPRRHRGVPPRRADRRGVVRHGVDPGPLRVR